MNTDKSEDEITATTEMKENEAHRTRQEFVTRHGRNQCFFANVKTNIDEFETSRFTSLSSFHVY